MNRPIPSKPGRSIMVSLLIPAVALLALVLLLATARVYALGSASPALAPSETAELALEPGSPAIMVGETIAVSVVVTAVTDLYGVELALTFDPAVVAVVDANSGASGIQITPGSCPPPNFVAINSADNSAGTVNYATTALAPAVPCVGSGVIAVITFQALAEGTTPISFTNWLLSDSNVQTIAATITSGTLTVQPRPGALAGHLSLQGRSDHGGALITAWDGGTPLANTVSGTTGQYSLTLLPAAYTLTVELAGYLDALRPGLLVTAGETLDLPALSLLCGDPNDDDLVNIQDLSMIGARYKRTCADPDWDGLADMIDDCVINILDLTCAGANYHRTSPVPWP
jgi:hypothetical protein